MAVLNHDVAGNSDTPSETIYVRFVDSFELGTSGPGMPANGAGPLLDSPRFLLLPLATIEDALKKDGEDLPLRGPLFVAQGLDRIDP